MATIWTNKKDQIIFRHINLFIFETNKKQRKVFNEQLKRLQTIKKTRPSKEIENPFFFSINVKNIKCLSFPMEMVVNCKISFQIFFIHCWANLLKQWNQTILFNCCLFFVVFVLFSLSAHLISTFCYCFVSFYGIYIVQFLTRILNWRPCR